MCLLWCAAGTESSSDDGMFLVNEETKRTRGTWRAGGLRQWMIPGEPCDLSNSVGHECRETARCASLSGLPLCVHTE